MREILFATFGSKILNNNTIKSPTISNAKRLQDLLALIYKFQAVYLLKNKNIVK